MKWKNKGHEFDDTGLFLKGKKHIYLYGAGVNASELIFVITHLREWIDWEIHLVDRDPEKQKSGLDGYPVLSSEEFFSQEKEDYFVVVCSFALPPNGTADEICGILKEHGIPDELVFRYFYFLHTYLPVYFAYVHDMVFFTSQNIIPSTVCNLNCRDCLNFTPYIKKHITASWEDVKKDVDLFFNAVDKIYRFQVSGGEPMLYSRLKDLLEYIGEHYREKIIRLELVTNGTIVPSDELCAYLSQRNIYVYLDDYRMSCPNGEGIYQQVYEKFQKFHVNFWDNHVDVWMRLYLPELERKGRSDQQKVELFRMCGNPWSTVWKEGISACNYSVYAAKAGLCGEFEDDYYDLSTYTPDKKKELVEFRVGYNEKGYVSFCEKCEGFGDINQHWCEPAIQAKEKLYEMDK